MARFERRRRREARSTHEPDPWLDDPAPAAGEPDDERPPLPTAQDRDADPRPATRSASPALWAPRRPGPDSFEVDDDPVTDPFGFPPVPPVVAAAPVAPDPVPTWAAWVPATSRDRLLDDPPRAAAQAGPSTGPDIRPAADHGRDATDHTSTALVRRAVAPVGPGARRPAAPARTPDGDRTTVSGVTPSGDGPTDPAPPGEPAPDRAEAAALAGAFAADYLSWDEDDPARRGRALADHLPGPPTDRALLGWSGRGRQRVEIVLPGAVRPDDEGRLLVDVRVRVTPYRRVSRSDAAPEPEPSEVLGTVAAAPPVTARGWRGLAGRWVRLVVTVAVDSDRLVVDAGEETLGEGVVAEQTVGERDAPALRRIADDPTLDGDDSGAATHAGSTR